MEVFVVLAKKYVILIMIMLDNNVIYCVYDSVIGHATVWCVVRQCDVIYHVNLRQVCPPENSTCPKHKTIRGPSPQWKLATMDLHHSLHRSVVVHSDKLMIVYLLYVFFPLVSLFTACTPFLKFHFPLPFRPTPFPPNFLV